MICDIEIGEALGHDDDDGYEMPGTLFMPARMSAIEWSGGRMEQSAPKMPHTVISRASD